MIVHFPCLQRVLATMLGAASVWNMFATGDRLRVMPLSVHQRCHIQCVALLWPAAVGLHHLPTDDSIIIFNHTWQVFQAACRVVLGCSG